MINFYFKEVLFQPTTRCNLNCKYCYLPDRNTNLLMSLDVAKNLASNLADFEHNITLAWHAGEPLVIGVEYAEQLLSCFEELRKQGRIRHNLQTNATLINDKWCELFKRYDFSVNVSIDGPDWATSERVNWNNKPVYHQIIKGIEKLKEHEIKFAVICVVSKHTISKPQELYDFFVDLGCSGVAFNIVEAEGINVKSSGITRSESQLFWASILSAWRDNPSIFVRELDYVLKWAYINSQLEKPANVFGDISLNSIPVVDWQGNVCFLSPELTAFGDKFISGNLLNLSLKDMFVGLHSLQHVKSIIKGVELCKQQCKYFSYCNGGWASNKYSEHNTFEATETDFCRNSRQALVDAVVFQV